MTPRRRVLVIGGGLAGLTTAHELSRTSELRDAWDVRVLESSHRFGGRLASAHRAEASHRNEEHGLHVWFGFYDNTFRLAEEVWAQFARPAGSPFTTVWDALRPIYWSDHGMPGEGPMEVHRVHHPRNCDRPGASGERSWAAWLTGGLDQLRAIQQTVRSSTTRAPVADALPPVVAHALWPAPSADSVVRTLETLSPVLDRILRIRIPPGARGRRRFGLVVEQLLRRVHGPAVETARRVAGGERGPIEIARVLDLVLAAARGITSPTHGIMEDGDLDRIGAFELRTFLKEHGATDETLANSRLLECLYDMPFAYLGGDRARPVMEAGTALRYALRILTDYKHAIAYLLCAGAGEVLVAPLCDLLETRGVTLTPFHRLERMEIDPATRTVSRLVVRRLARPHGGTYVDRATRNGLRVQRVEADFDQLEDGDRLRADGVDFHARFPDDASTDLVTFEVGRDFDDVVLALPLGCIVRDHAGRSPVSDWLAHHPAAEACFARLHLVPTVAAQVWLDQSPEELGILDQAVVTWAEPYSVVCDMTPVIAHEGWAAPGPRGCIYLCGAHPLISPTLPTPTEASRAIDAETARRALVRQLADHGASFFGPSATTHGPSGEGYVRTNVDPPDLADLPLPGADAVRLEATDTGLINLALAGTWVRTHVNTTSLEAAVASGIAAARALGASVRPILAESFLRTPPTQTVLEGRAPEDPSHDPARPSLLRRILGRRAAFAP